MVPGVRPPEARSDLVDLMRVVNDHIAAALGVSAIDFKPRAAPTHSFIAFRATGACVGHLRGCA